MQYVCQECEHRFDADASADGLACPKCGGAVTPAETPDAAAPEQRDAEAPAAPEPGAAESSGATALLYVAVVIAAFVVAWFGWPLLVGDEDASPEPEPGAAPIVRGPTRPRDGMWSGGGKEIRVRFEVADEGKTVKNVAVHGYRSEGERRVPFSALLPDSFPVKAGTFRVASDTCALTGKFTNPVHAAGGAVVQQAGSSVRFTGVWEARPLAGDEGKTEPEPEKKAEPPP